MACNQNAGLKECPIIFSGPMVRAILEGRKTQTRRIVKPQPTDAGLVWVKTKEGFAAWVDKNLNLEEGQMRLCPYGQPGTKLWVREPHYLHGHWTKRGKTATGRTRYKFIVHRHPGVRFPGQSLSELKPYGWIEKSKNASGWFKRPSIFMPRWASRITLEITGVRVERLLDMTDTDGMREGWRCDPRNLDYLPRMWFRDLWESLNGPGSWEKNPWVWVIEFRRIDGKV